MFGMKAHFIDTHLLVPRSRSSTKVKVKYQGHVSQKMGVSSLQYKFFETLWEKEKLLLTSKFCFPTVFRIPLENFPLFSLKLKLLSSNSFSLEESKICGLGKG